MYGDVTDYGSVRQGMQGCSRGNSHGLAVVGASLPEEDWWHINRDGSRNVLQAAHEQGLAGMVQVSTLSVLGSTQPGETGDESRPIDPALHVNLYQKTKFAADEIARDYAAKGLPVKIVYPGFGFGCSFASSHPSLQDQTLLRMAGGVKKPPSWETVKTGLCLAYYNDTVAGINLAHQVGKPGEGYILGNENLTSRRYGRPLLSYWAKNRPKEHIPLSLLRDHFLHNRKLRGRPVFPQDFLGMVALNWCFSCQKARDELGWQPKSFADAISEPGAPTRNRDGAVS